MRTHAILVIAAPSTALLTTGLYPIAQYLATVSWGTGYLLSRFLVIWPLSCLTAIVLTILCGLFLKGAYRKVGMVVLVAALLILPRPFSFQLGYQIRHAAFVRLAERSKPLIVAIESYKQHVHKLPSSLNELVPSFLYHVPGTGMAAYPEYTYAVDAQSGTYALVISTPDVGIPNLDEFRYSSSGEYPDYGKYWEPIGDWKYYHE